MKPSGLTPTYVTALTATFLCGLKLLLLPAYKSTDFEVHRNWLAITHSRPLKKWYTEETSVWTLDYPPLFAWFEWSLSLVAAHVDPYMVEVSNLGYASDATVLFQRVTVIASDVLLLLAAFVAGRVGSKGGKLHWSALLMLVMIATNPGLLIVDHIHFQYNGAMIGLLLLSVLASEQQRDLLSALLFAVLLNMKHIFAYAAPVYFVYLLRHYCCGSLPTRLARFLQLAGMVLAVCVVSFGPFVWYGQLEQILSRLFPFGRGLTHSYWAGNAWAMYCAVDKVLAAVGAAAGLAVERVPGNMAGGLVGITKFAVLPQIGPRVTMAAVLLALLPCLCALWRKPHPSAVSRAVAYANLCGFMFGYHVHEKAILPVLLPFALFATRSPNAAAHFLVLSAAGHYGLLPLLFHPAEYPIKLLLVSLFTAAYWYGLSKLFEEKQAGDVLGWTAKAYIFGFVVVELYCSCLHGVLLKGRLPFVPLMLTSLYCSLGIGTVWWWMAVDFLSEAWGSGGSQKQKRR